MTQVSNSNLKQEFDSIVNEFQTKMSDFIAQQGKENIDVVVVVPLQSEKWVSNFWPEMKDSRKDYLFTFRETQFECWIKGK